MADTEQILLDIDDSGATAARDRQNKGLDDFEQHVHKTTQAVSQTWKQFVAENMAAAMKATGSHGEAMKQLGQQWRQMQATAQTAQSAIQRGGEVMVRTSDRTAGAIEREIRALERRAAVAGKGGSERMAAERDAIIQKLAGEEKAVERVRAAYSSLISEQKKGEMAALLDTARAASDRAAKATTNFNSALASVNQSHKEAAEKAALARAEWEKSTSVFSTFGSSLSTISKSAVAQIGAMYLSFQGLKMITRDVIGESAIYAARTETMGVAMLAAGKTNDVSAASLKRQEQALKQLGITTQEARQSLLRMMTAQIDVSKATELGRLAQNAAVIGLMNSSEAFDHLVYGIQSGQPRVLRTIGINVEFAESYQRMAKQLGKTTLELDDYEKTQARVNEVLRVAPRFAGLYESAMGSVGKQMTSLKRYFEEAKNAVGDQFQPALQAAVNTLEGLLKLIASNPQLGTFLTTLAAAGAVGGGIAALGGGKAGLVAGLALAVPAAAYGAGKVGLRALDVAGGWAIGAEGPLAPMYGNERQEYWDTARQSRLRGFEDVSRGLMKDVGLQMKDIRTERWKAYETGAPGETGFAARLKKANQDIDAAAADMDITAHRAAVKIKESIEEQQKAYEKSLKIAEHMKLLNPLVSRYYSTGQLGFGDKTTGRESGSAAGLGTWLSGIQTDQAIRDAQMGKFSSGPPGALTQATVGGAAFGEWAKGFEADRKVYDDLHLRSTERELKMQEQLVQLQAGGGAGSQRNAIERTYTLRMEYAEKVYDIERQIHGEAMAGLQLQERKDQARVERITELAALERRRFDQLKDSVGSLFDEMVSGAHNLGSVLWGIFKTSVLAPVKEAFSTMAASAMMPLLGGGRQQSGGGGGGFSLGSLLGGFGGGGGNGGLGGLLGGGGGSYGGGWQGGTVFSAAPSGASTSVPLAYPGGSANSGFVDVPGFGVVPAGLFSGAKGSFGERYGGSLAMLGATAGLGLLSYGAHGPTSGRKTASTIAGGAMMGGSIGYMVGGPVGAGVGIGIGVGGGMMLDGFRRKGVGGVMESTAGGALAGFMIGGPIGAAIGAGVGLVVGLVGAFRKSAEQKVREKIKAVWSVDIADKGILAGIVDTAKQAFGGNLDLAVRSPQIKELVQLYAMMTGQQTPWAEHTGPASMMQVGGQLYQQPAYVNGSPYSYQSPLPTLGLDSLRAGMQYSAGGPTVIQLDPQATRDLLSGRAVAAVTSNRNQISATVLQPGLVRA